MATTPIQTIDSITQFTRGTKEKWENVALPIPKGVLTIAIDTGDVKLGDGTTLYTNLPVLFKLSQILTIMDELSNKVDQSQLNELLKSAVFSRAIYDNGEITTSSWAPDITKGLTQKALISVSDLTILMPILPSDTNSGDLDIKLTTSLPSTVVTLGQGVVYKSGSDGCVLLKDQVYIYHFRVIDDIAQVETILIPTV